MEKKEGSDEARNEGQGQGQGQEILYVVSVYAPRLWRQLTYTVPANARSSVATAPTGTRSGTASTSTTTRRSRQTATEPTPSTTARPAPRASSSRAPPSETKPSKRRAATHDTSDDATSNLPEAQSRPRKRRKLEVEVVEPFLPHHPSEPESSREAIPRTRNGQPLMMDVIDEVDEHRENEPVRPPNRSHRKVPSKGKVAEDSSSEDLPPVVPLSKVGPPRRLKRSRQNNSTSIDSDKPTSGSRKNVHDGSPSRSRDQHSVDPPHSNGRPTKPSHSGRLHITDDLEEESASDEEELMNPAFLSFLKQVRRKPGEVLPETRQLLAQEEEENTQEAASWIPSHSSPVVQHPASPKARQSSAPSTGPWSDGNAKAGPSKPNGNPALQGRPSANDTFSREGIVPETQPYTLPASPGSPPHHTPLHDDPVVNENHPSTPHRAQGARQPGASRTASSVKAKMKPRRTSTKELRPVPSISPSVFFPHLPSVDEDEIEDFSSPEKDTRKKRSRLNVPTQDTIETADFTQEPMEEFVDWDGGVELDEDLFTAEADDHGPPLSLGPNLLSHDKESGSRRAMTSVFSKVRPLKIRRSSLLNILSATSPKTGASYASDCIA